MTSMIRTLIERFYPPTNTLGHTVTILGLPNSGKTTLLYLLRTGEIVQTTSTMGINIETVDVKTASNKPFRMTGWDIGRTSDITGLYGFIRTYTASTEAIIWVVDSSDRNRLPESVDALTRVISGVDQDRINTSKNLPILILANKSDKPGAISLDEIRITFSKTISGRIVSIFRTSLTSTTNPHKPNQTTGLPEAFDWLILVLNIARNIKSATVDPPKTTAIATTTTTTVEAKSLSPNTLSHKLESWLTRIETDFPHEEFLAKFRSFTLPSWDHYTHVRIAYVILTKYGRKDGKEMIFKGIEKYLAIGPQTTGKSFHITMTYFWIQIVHFGIRNMPPPSPHSTPSSPSGLDYANASPEDFAKFLLINPHVVDGNLWMDYYTKEVLMSTKAKDEMVLPDKKPLPNLVIRDAISSYIH